MQISFDDDSRVYIFLCPFLSDKKSLPYVIIHEEYDNNSELSQTQIISNATAKLYIRNLTSISYIGIREDPEDDSSLTCLTESKV